MNFENLFKISEKIIYYSISVLILTIGILFSANTDVALAQSCESTFHCCQDVDGCVTCPGLLNKSCSTLTAPACNPAGECGTGMCLQSSGCWYDPGSGGTGEGCGTCSAAGCAGGNVGDSCSNGTCKATGTCGDGSIQCSCQGSSSGDTDPKLRIRFRYDANHDGDFTSAEAVAGTYGMCDGHNFQPLPIIPVTALISGVSRTNANQCATMGVWSDPCDESGVDCSPVTQFGLGTIPNTEIFQIDIPSGYELVDGYLYVRGGGTCTRNNGSNVVSCNLTDGDNYIDLHVIDKTDSPPTCTLTGTTSVCRGDNGSYTANCADSGGTLNRISMAYSPTGTVTWLPLIGWPTCSFSATSSQSCGAVSKTWTEAAGSYYMVVNANDLTSGDRCTGNPWCEWEPNPPSTLTCATNTADDGREGWSDCYNATLPQSPNDVLQVNVVNPPSTTPSLTNCANGTSCTAAPAVGLS